MDIKILCDKTGLCPEIKRRALAFAETFDFSPFNDKLMGFRDYEKMSETLAELRELLGDDPDNIKILVCLLKASADLYDAYNEKGICDEIYFDTMKCYARFIDETYRMTGRRYFDRYWWTTRQAGLHLFRIGQLEYEMKRIGGDTAVIGIHIPSDADFSPPEVEKSLYRAKEFFGKHFPALSDAEYRCHSWLLDRQLKDMLDGDSNILSFQERFEIYDDGEASFDHIGWVFNIDPADYRSMDSIYADHNTLPENTSLQRKLKKHLLSGGVIRNAYGRLKKTLHDAASAGSKPDPEKIVNQA